MVTEFSEPDGYFDTDNLISNETTYLDAAVALRESKSSGGIYIGVGPDQNFSYIAQIKPEMAYLVDLRRDNLLLHLEQKVVRHPRAEERRFTWLSRTSTGRGATGRQRIPDE